MSRKVLRFILGSITRETDHGRETDQLTIPVYKNQVRKIAFVERVRMPVGGGRLELKKLVTLDCGHEFLVGMRAKARRRSERSCNQCPPAEFGRGLTIAEEDAQEDK
jgi:hypothetical protein